MGKKMNVVGDELDIKGAGLYCLMPYERLDNTGKAVFKIGMTAKSFEYRLEIYHSYYPLGVYMVCFLQNPPVDGLKFKTKTQLYLHIERFIMEKLKEIRGTHQITSTSRVRNLNVNKEGETEFFYTTQKHINDVFNVAQEEFGGELFSFTLDHINNNYEKNMKANKKYVAEIVYKF